MKKMMMLSAFILFAGAPAFAQQTDTLPAANNVIVQTPDANTTVTVQHGANGKSVRDMTDSERAAFWANLPDEEKQRIIARRQQMQAAKNPWKGSSASQSADADAKLKALDDARAQAQTGIGVTMPGGSSDLNASMARGKAQWDAMSDEEKRAFVQVHQDEIRAAVQAHGGQ